MAENRLRVGLIGANANRGWAPRAHLPALTALPDVELVAVCTTREDTARETAEKFGVPMAFHDHREMLRRPEIDAVAVSVRVPLHHSVTMDALEAGKHVYTEWPLGANLREAEEMAALARSKGVHTMVGLQGRCSPLFLTLKELIDSDYVGEVVSCHMTQFGALRQNRTSASTWSRDAAAGANAFAIDFGHLIDALCMCVGEFKQVSAMVTTQVKQWYESDTQRMVDVTAPDNVLLGGMLESGAVVSAHVSNEPWHGSEYRLEVYGHDGTIVVTAPENAQWVGGRLEGGRSTDSALRELPISTKHTWVPDTVPEGLPFNVAQMWSRFADAIRTGNRAKPDFDSAVARHRLLDAIQRASDTGQRQSL